MSEPFDDKWLGDGNTEFVEVQPSFAAEAVRNAEELSRLRAENERLTAERDRAIGKRKVWHEFCCRVLHHQRETARLANARALAAEARAEKAVEAARNCASLLEIIAEDAQKSGDTITWSLAAVMADDTRRTISSLASLPKESADV